MTGNLNFSFSFMQIFKVGMEEAIKNHITVSSSHFNMIESALKELGNEIQKVEQETESTVLAKKQTSWLQFHMQNLQARTLSDAIEQLTEQQRQAIARAESYKDDMVRLGEISALGKAYKSLSEKEDETKNCLGIQISSIGKQFP